MIKFHKKAFLLTSVFAGLLFTKSVQALTYSTDVNVSFTFNPSIALNVSGDLIIPNLIPGTYSDSNVITVTPVTNSAFGYSLSATVGVKNGTDALVGNQGVNPNPTFANLASNVASLNLFPENRWGYSYSTDNGTNWVSGDTGSTASGYDGLPLDNNTDTSHRGEGGVTLLSTSGISESQPIKFKIGAAASSSQPAGVYTNVINFYLVANPIPPTLYQMIEQEAFGLYSMYSDFDDYYPDKYNTRTLPVSELYQGTIQEPSISQPISSNSGVFLYDEAIYGESSDPSNDYPIYFYRGILDSYDNLSRDSNGGNGNGPADVFPNYVSFANSCWRIVRTTGNGSIEVILNSYASSCSSNNFPTVQNAWDSSKFLNVVGYSFRETLPSSTAQYTAKNVFGANDNYYSINLKEPAAVDTMIETYDPIVGSISDLIDIEATHCNDRSFYNGDRLVSDNEIIQSYSTYDFGARYRNFNATSIVPTLSCPRGKVDLYSWSLSYGNGQLHTPLAMLTADEATLAGSGHATYGTYSSYSYLHLPNNKGFWLMSPMNFATNYTDARVGRINGAGSLGAQLTNSATDMQIRPVVTLNNGVFISSGSGTMNDPWVISF